MAEINKYLCARCNSDIKVNVDRCMKCNMDFHPCCVKFHKFVDENNKRIKCDGPYKKINLQSAKKDVCSPNLSSRRSAGSSVINNVQRRSSVAMNNDQNQIINENTKKHKEDLLELKQFLAEQIKSKFMELKNSMQEFIVVEINKNREVCENIMSNKIQKIQETATNQISKVLKTEINIFKQDLFLKNNKNSDNISPPASGLKYREEQPTEKIVIKPKNQQDCEKTAEHIKNNIDVGDLGIGINKISV